MFNLDLPTIGAWMSLLVIFVQAARDFAGPNNAQPPEEVLSMAAIVSTKAVVPIAIRYPCEFPRHAAGSQGTPDLLYKSWVVARLQLLTEGWWRQKKRLPGIHSV